MSDPNLLLLVEDNEDDAFIMKRALNSAGIQNPILLLEDGQEALDYLAGEGEFRDRDQFPLPVLIFLDLKLPLKSGFEVLKYVRSSPELVTIVVVVLTSSDATTDIEHAYQLGVNSYLVKPPTAEELSAMARAFKGYWLEYNRFDLALAG